MTIKCDLDATTGRAEEEPFPAVGEGEFDERAEVDGSFGIKSRSGEFVVGRSGLGGGLGLTGEAVGEVVFLGGAGIVFALGLTFGVVAGGADLTGGILLVCKVLAQDINYRLDKERLVHGEAATIPAGGAFCK